jgi:hypothetical protein
LTSLFDARQEVRRTLGLVASLSALLASDHGLVTGEHVWAFAEGARYEVAAVDATDAHVTRTSDGRGLYVLPSDDGRYNGVSFGMHPNRADTTDDSVALQTAIEVAYDNGGGQVVLPSGTFYITGVTLRAFVSLIGTGNYRRGGATTVEVGTELKALPGTTTMIVAAGEPYVDENQNVVYLRSSSVVGIMLDGDNQAQVGINITETVQPNIAKCGFRGFVGGAPDGDGGTLPGGAAIYGGGILYNIIEENSFSPGDYYALYSQQALCTNSDIYYGANHGAFRNNAIHCKYGVVHEGIQDIYGNAFEVKGQLVEAILWLNGDGANSYGSVWGNYFEMYTEVVTEDPLTYMDVTAIKTKAFVGGIFCNQIYGPKSSHLDPGAVATAIDLSQTNYGVSVWGNEIKYWVTGIKLPSRDGGAPTISMGAFDIGNNHMSAVMYQVVNGPDEAREIGDDTLGYLRLDWDDAECKYRLGGTFSGAAVLGTNVTKEISTLNLKWGNHFRIDHAHVDPGTPALISSIINKGPGSLFTISSREAGKTALDRAAFGLASDADLLLPADVDLLFVSDADGNVREVGMTSAMLQDAQGAPTNATTPAAWREYPPGSGDFMPVYR